MYDFHNAGGEYLASNLLRIFPLGSKNSALVFPNLVGFGGSPCR